MNDIDKVVFFIDECKRMGLSVLGPDVNESNYKFSVNENGEIRFGLGAIKGVGEAAIKAIVEEREQNGRFEDLFDLTKRVNLRAVNRKALEGLGKAGAFDGFANYYRSQYFHKESEKDFSLIEKAVKFGQKAKELEATSKQSLFGDSQELQLDKPKAPDCPPWSLMETLRGERELIGFYVSGHPLDDFKFEYEKFCEPFDQESLKNKFGREVSIGGIIASVTEKYDKRGRKFAFFTLEGYEESLELALFSELYLNYQGLIAEGTAVHIKGTVQNKFKKDDEYDVKIQKMQYLANLRDQISAITLDLNLENIGDHLIDHLEELVHQYQGSQCRLTLNIHDPENQIQLSMPSTVYKVDPSDGLFDSIQRMEEVRDFRMQLA